MWNNPKKPNVPKKIYVEKAPEKKKYVLKEDCNEHN
jgi:hypothetical protein